MSDPEQEFDLNDLNGARLPETENDKAAINACADQVWKLFRDTAVRMQGSWSPQQVRDAIIWGRWNIRKTREISRNDAINAIAAELSKQGKYMPL
jgi:hypothetical protein